MYTVVVFLEMLVAMKTANITTLSPGLHPPESRHLGYRTLIIWDCPRVLVVHPHPCDNPEMHPTFQNGPAGGVPLPGSTVREA